MYICQNLSLKLNCTNNTPYKKKPEANSCESKKLSYFHVFLEVGGELE